MRIDFLSYLFPSKSVPYLPLNVSSFHLSTLQQSIMRIRRGKPKTSIAETIESVLEYFSEKKGDSKSAVSKLRMLSKAQSQQSDIKSLIKPLKKIFDIRCFLMNSILKQNVLSTAIIRYVKVIQMTEPILVMISLVSIPAASKLILKGCYSGRQ